MALQRGAVPPLNDRYTTHAFAKENPMSTTHPRFLRRLVILVLTALAQAPATAATWYVDDTCTAPGTGTSSDPYCTIQDGIDRAGPGDTVRVRDGVYTGSRNRDLGWSTANLTVKSENGAGTCTIDCQHVEGGDPRTGFYFDANKPGPNARIDGFTIRNAYGGWGGGVACQQYSGPITIENCVIIQNTATEGAGIDCVPNSQCVIRNCVITDNTAHTWGGGVIAEGVSLIENTIIAGNKVVGCCGCDQYDRVGGGVGVQASSASGQGLKIVNSVIAGNKACFGGGVIDAAPGTYPGISVVNSVIAGNNAEQYGGGLVVSGLKLNAAVTNSILWFNESTEPLGKQIYLRDHGTLSVSFSNVQGGEAVVGPAGQTGLDWLPSYGNIGGAPNNADDPLFVNPLGGDSDPLTYDAGTDYRIAAGSPVIDAAKNFFIDNYETDLAGLSRFVEDPNSDDIGSFSTAHACALADMGAYEYQPVFPDCNANGVPDRCDLSAGTSVDCDANGVPDEDVCQPGTQLNAWVGATPPDQGSLWRSQKNIIRLSFACNIASAPQAGQVLVQQMLPGGGYGADLSAGFTMSVENNSVLKLQETGATLLHRTWYAVRNTGAWGGMAPFAVQYVVQVGDANANKVVLNADVSFINGQIPCTSGCGDANRSDIDGDLNVLNADSSIANSKVPSFAVSKPSGH
jgi:hypothetical protein